MSFIKYSSLENHTNNKFITKIQHQVDEPDMVWVAREKIHGTNFSVVITENDIVPCKRSGPILPAEKFNNYLSIMQKYKDSFEQIQEITKGSTVQIFGEYAGDGIQKGIEYGEQDFYIFDVMINGEYITEVLVEDFAKDFKLKTAPLIKFGTLKELLSLPVEFDTIVKDYKLFEENTLPPAGDNVSEGLVIKPNTPIFLADKRVAIKYKSDKYKEKSKGKLPKIEVPLTEKDHVLLEQLNEFNTLNRVKNVISHIGQVTTKDFGKVSGLTVQDILTESAREGVDIMTAESINAVKKELVRNVQDTIRKDWINLIED